MAVNYPNVIGKESYDIKERILKKYEEYLKVYNSNGDPVQLKGERYEIVVAIELNKKLLFTNGKQISRWHSEGAPQNISLGTNTEYDFIIPDSKSIRRLRSLNDTGPVLGEAKSYTDSLGEYIKKSIGYCLNDPTLGGFCFVTPGDDYKLFLQLTHETIAILAGKVETPAITGADSWRNKSEFQRNGKPAGTKIIDHFHEKYYSEPPYLNQKNHLEILQNKHASDVTGYVNNRFNEHTKKDQAEYYQLLSNRRKTALHFNEEISTKAGFVVACYQIKNKEHTELEKDIKLLRSSIKETN